MGKEIESGDQGAGWKFKWVTETENLMRGFFQSVLKMSCNIDEPHIILLHYATYCPAMFSMIGALPSDWTV
jgi:hypothetical protein